MIDTTKYQREWQRRHDKNDDAIQCLSDLELRELVQTEQMIEISQNLRRIAICLTGEIESDHSNLNLTELIEEKK